MNATSDDIKALRANVEPNRSIFEFADIEGKGYLTSHEYKIAMIILFGNKPTKEEEKEDASVVCEVRDLSLWLNPFKQKLLHKESGRDLIISEVLHYAIEGWPRSDSTDTKHFKKLEDFLTVDNRCLF
ncbi:hypothetical protein J437_LFUL016538 [Ladona fulva]|uniref:EF-hand domain-containing protein n=1 Tax=Ladona fulva TaxID=123851 RepID=A0A8K0KLT5_LADFU|nr:hypothetical protein J437_LFUL016538 [Ladona fulva]